MILFFNIEMPLNQFARGNVTAMVRDLLDNNAPIVPVQGTPTSNTLAGLAGPGALALDVINGIAYINTGTIAIPDWSSLSSGGVQVTQKFVIDFVAQPFLGIAGQFNDIPGVIIPENAMVTHAALNVLTGFGPTGGQCAILWGSIGTPDALLGVTTVLGNLDSPTTLASVVQLATDTTWIQSKSASESDRTLEVHVIGTNLTVGLMHGWFTYVI